MSQNSAATSWTLSDRLAGAIPPLVTPIDEHGNVDVAGVEALVRYTLGGGCSGLFVAGGCGLGPWLTNAQRRDVVRAVVRATAGRAPVLAGVMMPSTGPTVEVAKELVDEGADAVVVASPYYFGVDGGDQQRHAEAVLRAVNVPILIYNIPQCTHQLWAHATVATLAREPRVLGIKDSSGDLPGFQRFLRIKDERPDFRVLQGDERVMGLAMLAGGDGVIAGLANVAPALFAELVQTGARGDTHGTRALQQRVLELFPLFSYGHNLAALTAACALLGMGTGRTAAPWERPTAAEEEQIATVLRHNNLPVIAAAAV